MTSATTKLDKQLLKGRGDKALSGVFDTDLEARAATDNLLSFTRIFFKEVQGGAEFARSEHHRIICRALERVFRAECKRLMINIPPRYSKTELVAINFPAWCFAKEPRCRFIHLSYSNDLVETNCKAIQSIMRSQKYQGYWGDSALLGNRPKAQRFYTARGGEFYTASTGGQITGFGAGAVDAKDDKALEKETADNARLASFDAVAETKAKTGYNGEELPKFMGAIIIDDPIKPADAMHETIRERINERFENTIRSRANSVNTPIIIIMQRTHEHDLCGYLQELEGHKWEVISLPAISVDPETGEERALWHSKHSVPALRELQNSNRHVFETQYLQNPQPREGLMYEYGFREWEVLPNEQAQQYKSVTDTASSGDNYTCSISYIETRTAMYVTDIVYTQKNTDYTIPKIAEMHKRNGTKIAIVEANNGGDQQCRRIKEAAIAMGHTSCSYQTKHQKDNKEMRIRTKAPDAMNLIVFPKGWERRWPEFHQQLTSHRYVAAYNKYDDAPDGVTYMVEYFGKRGGGAIAV